MRALTSLLTTLALFTPVAVHADDTLQVLFLGDHGHHRPEERFLQLEPVLKGRGIELTYVGDVAKALSPETLAKYDGLLLYANIDRIEPAQADALLAYVAGGKGFIPLHCATYCFRNDERIVSLMGGQFKRHGGEVFSTVIAEPHHPIMQGFGGFTSWDETYIHTLHNDKDRTVLEYRAQGDQEPGQDREPWTWTRTHEQGRIFYTAWGHDERTWGHAGFQNLIERGVRWACGDDPAKAGPYHEQGRFTPLPMTAPRTDVQPFEYVEVGAKIPHYVPGDKWGLQEAPYTKMQLPLSPEESIKHYLVPQGFELRLFACEAPTQPQSDTSDDATINQALSAGMTAKDRPYAGLGGKPIAMNWDERGRLWVCETMDYPNQLQRDNKGRDRIRVCEDTDGDGQADKFTLFAEGLSVPTAILPVFDGVLVQNGTETLFLKDTNGDEKADLREVLITGWNMGDTHGGVSNFRYGLDNWVYAMQGYNDSEPVIAATGEKGPRFRQGFFRMKLAGPKESSVKSPESRADVPTKGALDSGHSALDSAPQVLAIEFLRSTNNNTWGLGISEEGLIFGSTANHNPSEFMPIPNRYYERVLGWGPSRLEGIADSHLFKAVTPNVRQVDQFGGYTAGAGHALYTARNYPQQYWNRTAFVCEPTGHLVGTFVLTPDGAGYKSTSPCNLIASDDEWASPIMAEVGPDGNVWILDWYNYIIQHNPTPQGFLTGRGNAYESELRDKRHGRIYRLVYTGASEPRPSGSAGTSAAATPDDPRGPDLSKATPEQLVEALRNPTMEVRLQAQRLLVEQGQQAAFGTLVDITQDQSVDAIGLNPTAIHALWTLDGLGYLSPDRHEATPADQEWWKFLAAAVKHPSRGVRLNAARVLPWPAFSDDLLVDHLLQDQDRQVLLASILKFGDITTRQVGTASLRLALDANVMSDRWLADAVTSTSAAAWMPFLEACEHQAPAALAEANSDAAVWKIVRRLGEHIGRSNPPVDCIDDILRVMKQTDGLFTTTLLDGLAAGWQRDHKVELSADSERALLELLDRVEGADKAKVIRLASLWGSKQMEQHSAAIVESMLAVIQSAEEPVPMRRDAATQLISFRPNDAAVVSGIVAQITPQAPPALAKGLIEALGGSTAENVGPELIDRAGVVTPALREQLLSVLLARPQTTLALLDGVATGKVSLNDLKLDQKAALANHPDRRVREQAKRVLEAGGALVDPDRQKVLDALLEIAKVDGDVAAGKEIFKKNCAKCHKHSGEGENIGPDLTGMAVHPKSELLVHILDPSRSVEGNFRAYTVVMNDGLTYSGMLAGESQTSIELITNEAKKHTLVRQDIDQLIASTKSVMPEGFEKTIPRADFVNLMEFLTAKGKWVPLDLRKIATSISTKPMFVNDTNDAERLIFPDWGPKMVGEVPFLLIDPKNDTTPNVLMLHGPNGKYPPQMPKSVSLPVNAKTKAVHFLSGVGGWAHPYGEPNGLSLIVRFKYADGQTEDHELRNGNHFADYIRRVDVPGSQFAFRLRGQQIRYLSVAPDRQDVPVTQLELVKGTDDTAPVVMAITVETP